MSEHGRARPPLLTVEHGSQSIVEPRRQSVVDRRQSVVPTTERDSGPKSADRAWSTADRAWFRPTERDFGDDHALTDRQSVASVYRKNRTQSVIRAVGFGGGSTRREPPTIQRDLPPTERDFAHRKIVDRAWYTADRAWFTADRAWSTADRAWSTADRAWSRTTGREIDPLIVVGPSERGGRTGGNVGGISAKDPEGRTDFCTVSGALSARILHKRFSL